MMNSIPPLMTVRVPPWLLKVLWVAIAVFNVVCGTMLAFHSLLYFIREAQSVHLLVSLELLGVHVRRDLYPGTAVITLGVAAIHFYQIATMMRRSINDRSLRFATVKAISPPSQSPQASRVGNFVAAILASFLPAASSRPRQITQGFIDFAHWIWKSFDVTSPNYGVVYALREIIQTGIQTQQAYNLSAHVTKTWMNHAIVFLLVINCWAMPLIQYGLKIKSTATVRLLCVLTNLVLDFVSYFAFPLALFMPYARDYNPRIGTFDRHFWYTDVWLIRLLNEWPLLFVTSEWDGFSKLLVAFSMTRSLRSVAKLLHTPITTDGQLSKTSQASIVPLSSRLLSSTRLSRRLSRLPPVPVLRSGAERWCHRALGLWGLLILILHIQSSSTKDNSQCLVQVRPWLVQRPVCSLMELSCYDNQASGNAPEFDDTLESIDTDWLAYLVIRHCPAVEITARIRDLSWLKIMKIYNSTLMKWDEDAALTQTHHPNVLLVYVVATNLSEFPRGLYHRDFPSQLMDVEFSYVNLTSFPVEIVDSWHKGMFLVLEALQLPAFPDAIAVLKPCYLSVALNNFTSIPREVLESPQLRVLLLSGNPIAELPAVPLTVESLFVVQTEIAAVPAWLAPEKLNYGPELVAGTSPLCEAFDQHNASALLWRSLDEMLFWERRINCTPAEKLRYLTHYPLVDEATNNPSYIA